MKFRLILCPLFLWVVTMPFLLNSYELSDNHITEIRLLVDEYSIPIELILALVFVESSNNPKAVSHVGAYGLFQITEIAENCVNEKRDLKLTRFVISENIQIGIYYIVILLNRFSYDYEKALRYYNGGGSCFDIPSTEIYYKKIMKLSGL